MKKNLCYILIILLTLAWEGARAQKTTNSHNYLVDASIAMSKPDKHMFKCLKEALRYAEKAQGETPELYSEESPLHIRIEPYVYWIDNPDDNETRKPQPGEGIPYGMKLKMSHLRLIGLGKTPDEVILACNRGQTHGAEGNFTMMHIEGDDIQLENITLGNYCNVDLIYPHNPTLNRQRRADAIVQAQLVICKGDKYVARNCRFISRLNLCPLAGAERALFEHCYFECTDDALCGTGVYLNCQFTFFSGKPFYATQHTGAVFLNCDIHALTQGRQYLVKVGSPVTMVDCRWTSEDKELYIGWTQDTMGNHRSYQYNLTLNGEPLFIGKEHREATIDMKDKAVLRAYKRNNGEYNVYNLLRGTDGWNPTEQKVENEQTEQHIPTLLTCSQGFATIETGVDSLWLKADEVAFGSRIKQTPKFFTWSVEKKDAPYVVLLPQENGRCLLKGNNHTEDERIVNVVARTKDGLETACLVRIKPQQLPPPTFIKNPKLKQKGEWIKVEYELDLAGRDDQSIVTWYRCTNKEGEHPIEVMTSRNNQPQNCYLLTADDDGYYLQACVSPKHGRSKTGDAKRCITQKPIKSKTKRVKVIETNFEHFSTAQQPNIIPGFWTLDAYKPIDTNQYDWQPDTTRNAWFFGEGMDGARGLKGLQQAVKGARMLYTPITDNYGDMLLNVELSPCKTAGQGFGSATGQYLDIYIKYDTHSLTGYGLRIIRTTKNDRAVDFQLMSYEKGVATPISEAVSSICYRTGCSVELKIVGNRFKAIAKNRFELPEPPHADVKKEVALEAKITENSYGGCGFQHTGSTGANATLLTYLKICYE